jgi:hypothetical protein
MIIKTRKELAETVRRVAGELKSHRLTERTDLMTVANMIEHSGHGAGILIRADHEMDQPHRGHPTEEEI